MKITDKEVKKLLSQCNSMDLSENIRSYPEDERDEQTDMESWKDNLAEYQREKRVIKRNFPLLIVTSNFR